MNGFILWEGNSALDGAPVVVIATGLAGSGNRKTGSMVQTWILRRDVSPIEAIHSGADESICGACPHRGATVNGRNSGRSCYVNVGQAPLSVWRAYMRSSYSREHNRAAELLAGRSVRLGAYGDPAAVPFEVWRGALAYAGNGTGYTHQWRTCDARLADYCMASADSESEALEARAMGWRTFRVGSRAESLVKRAEFLCPASEQAGKRLDCAACLACGGHRALNKASVFIPVHGNSAVVRNFENR